MPHSFNSNSTFYKNINKILYRLSLIKNYYVLKKKVLNCAKKSDHNTSCILFTTHKCASTFIGPLFYNLLKKSQYEFVDYESVIARLGDDLALETPYNKALQAFLEENYSDLYSLHERIYAPQRIPLDFPGRKKFKHVFFLRDPRDVLVSDYFSIAYTHAVPRNTETGEEFIAIRKKAERLGIDAYVLDEAETWIKPLFRQYKHLRDSAESHIYLKYDLFAESTLQFVELLSDYLGLKPSAKVTRLISDLANPIQKKERMRHQRSGKSGQYLDKLEAETVRKLNSLLAEELSEWAFPT